MSAIHPGGSPGNLSPDAVAASQMFSGPASWIDRTADRLNPIFIKETRQALKSKQFVIAFLLLLAAGWIVSVFAVLLNPDGLEYGSAGRDLFSTYFVILAAAIVVVVPFGAFRSLLTEREDSTFEPLIITTLKPRQIVAGKLLSALLQTFLFYSAIAPFIAFTALLGGFDAAFVSMVLLAGLGLSLWACMAALTISAMVKGRVWQTVVSLGVLAMLLQCFGGACSLAFSSNWVDWSNPNFLWGAALWVLAGASYLILLQQIAVVNLTFEADNRSTGLRLICTGQFLLLWSCVLVGIYVLGVTRINDLVIVAAILSLIHWSVAGLFFVTEPPGLSRRVARQLPRNGFLRLLAAPFFPGGSRALVYLLIQITLTVLTTGGLLYWLPGSLDPESSFVVAAALYLVIYLNIAATVSRWGMHWWSVFAPMHARVLVILIIALTMLVPVIYLAFRPYGYTNTFSYWMLPSFPLTLEHVGRHTGFTRSIITILSGAALIATAFNLPAMFQGIRQIVRAVPER